MYSQNLMQWWKLPICSRGGGAGGGGGEARNEATKNLLTAQRLGLGLGPTGLEKFAVEYSNIFPPKANKAWDLIKNRSSFANKV